ncbi:hypothetical protein AAFF_G00219430 [Aldrovandia affinis]|uniref:Uncharacterized protein n=1 Tax=Aldrovandia affinis TaxID=143900 RepID=A0AAD7W4W8_9TELE|nr:hypothetical protein AAFF_G00219430 [Aldrovandia affinis]
MTHGRWAGTFKPVYTQRPGPNEVEQKEHATIRTPCVAGAGTAPPPPPRCPRRCQAGGARTTSQPAAGGGDSRRERRLRTAEQMPACSS